MPQATHHELERLRVEVSKSGSAVAAAGERCVGVVAREVGIGVGTLEKWREDAQSNDLLVLHQFEGIPIVTPAQALARVAPAV